MTKYLVIGMLGYLVGLKHKQLSKHFCWNRMKKQAYRMMRSL